MHTNPHVYFFRWHVEIVPANSKSRANPKSPALTNSHIVEPIFALKYTLKTNLNQSRVFIIWLLCIETFFFSMLVQRRWKWCLIKHENKIAMMIQSTYSYIQNKPRTKWCTYCDSNLKNAEAKSFKLHWNARQICTLPYPSCDWQCLGYILVTGNNLSVTNAQCPVLSCGTYSGQTANF